MVSLKQSALAAAIILLMAPPQAYGCVMLEKGDPKVGSVVGAPIDHVTLTFSDTVFPDKSTLTVTDAQQHIVSTGKAYGDAHDDKIIAIKTQRLVPGKYEVRWQIWCSCQHLTPGDYHFTVQ